MNFRNQHPWRHNCRLIYNYHVKDTQSHGLSCCVWPQCMISKGNHVKFTLFVLSPVSEEAKTWPIIFCSMYNKTIVRFGFVISRIIKVSVRVISLGLLLQLIPLPHPKPIFPLLAHLHVFALRFSWFGSCNWPELSLWSWFYNSWLKTTLLLLFVHALVPCSLLSHCWPICFLMMTGARHQTHPVSINLLKLGKKKFELTDVFYYNFLINHCILLIIIKWDSVEIWC